MGSLKSLPQEAACFQTRHRLVNTDLSSLDEERYTSVVTASKTMTNQERNYINLHKRFKKRSPAGLCT